MMFYFYKHHMRAKMKILYITNLWTGLEDIVVRGQIEPKGMPAFIEPLKALISRGDEIDLYIIHKYEDITFNISVDWLTDSNIVGHINWKIDTPLKSIKTIYKLNKDIKKVLEEKQYSMDIGYMALFYINRS